jgi:hypothetical protein
MRYTVGVSLVGGIVLASAWYTQTQQRHIREQRSTSLFTGLLPRMRFAAARLTVPDLGTPAPFVRRTHAQDRSERVRRLRRRGLANGAFPRRKDASSSMITGAKASCRCASRKAGLRSIWERWART